MRQNLLKQMIEVLGFPKRWIAVEKEIDQMPHLLGKEIFETNRRVDIICFAKIHPEHALYPLLLIECKAVKLTNKVVEQVVGYNHQIGAPFLCIANQSETRTLWYNKEKNGFDSILYLPPFQELANTAKDYFYA